VDFKSDFKTITVCQGAWLPGRWCTYSQLWCTNM